jgi:hypothetical protein
MCILCTDRETQKQTLEYYGYRVPLHSCDNQKDCEEFRQAKARAFQTFHSAMDELGQDAQVVEM